MSKKWTAAKPSEKLLSLYTLLLFTNKEISLSELSTTLECSKQSVSRLINQLEGARFGKVLRAQKGREAVFSLERPKLLPKISLNAEGLYQLALCQEFLSHLLPPAMHEEMKSSLQQASAFLPEDAQEMPFGLGASLSKGWIDYAPFQEMLDTLIRAIREHRVCTVRYKAFLHGEEKSFEYAPKRILAFRESIMVRGWSVAGKGQATPVYDTPTTLSLQRFASCTVTQRSSTHVPGIPAPDNATFGIMDGSPFVAEVRFSREAATYAAERQWSAGQRVRHHEDGSVSLHISARSAPECIAWVLSFGETAEVVSPEWLQKAVGEKVQALAKRYALYDPRNQ